MSTDNMNTVNGNQIIAYVFTGWLALAVAFYWDPYLSGVIAPLNDLIGSTAIVLTLLLTFCLNRSWQYYQAKNEAQKQEAARKVHKNAEAAATVGTIGTFLAMAQMDPDSNMMTQVSFAINSSLIGMCIWLVFSYLIDKPETPPSVSVNLPETTPAANVNVPEKPQPENKGWVLLTKTMLKLAQRMDNLISLLERNKQAAQSGRGGSNTVVGNPPTVQYSEKQ